MSSPSNPLVLITGATGYIGSRLLATFEREGRAVRCMVRDPRRMRFPPAFGNQIVQGDALNPATLVTALADVDTAYYLLHAMEAQGDFAAKERQGAENFARAARAAGVRRVIYLGGLGNDEGELSPHLASRHKAGEILRREGPPTLELRAAIILGAGSLSFEIIRALVERLPVMITPRWVETRTQPIGINDVLSYLRAAAEIPLDVSRVVEIGGPDQVSYGDLMREYARQRGLRRLMIRVPVLTPRLSSLWLALVTPVYARVGRKLIEGLHNPTVVRDPSAATLFAIRPENLSAAITRALGDEDGSCRMVESFSRSVTATPAAIFAVLERIGGRNGWYYANFLWKLRGAIDRLLGGVGLRRKRNDPDHLKEGDPLDFWRVQTLHRDRRLLLYAEMKLPGRAWLEFSITEEAGGAVLRQTATFEPRGVGGRLYWHALYPAHRWIFNGMIRGIAAAAEKGLR